MIKNFQTYILMLTMLVMTAFYAQAERSVGLSINQIADDFSGGIHAKIPFDAGRAGVDIDSILQFGGTIRGRSHIELTIPIGVFGVQIYTDQFVKGYTFDELGRQSDVGAKVKLPSVGNVSLSAGFFGRNAGPFGPPNALDELEALGYDVEALEPLGLDMVTPKPKGLSIKGGSSFNAIIQAQFEVSNLKFKVQGMPELSTSDNRVHQLLTSVNTSWEIAEGVDINAGVDIGVQTYMDTVEAESAILLSLGYKF